MTTTASVRMTAGTLLGTVNEAATTVADTFGTVTKAVGMANRYVSDMAKKQEIRSLLEMEEFTNKLIEEKAMEEAIRSKSVKEFCKNEDNKQLYSEAYNRFHKILSKD